MSLLKNLRKSAADISTRAVAEAKELSERATTEAKEGLIGATKYVSEVKARVFSDSLPEIIVHLQNSDMDRIFLADALGTAYDAADKDASWDEIIKAALLDLQQTPAGGA